MNRAEATLKRLAVLEHRARQALLRCSSVPRTRSRAAGVRNFDRILSNEVNKRGRASGKRKEVGYTGGEF